MGVAVLIVIACAVALRLVGRGHARRGAPPAQPTAHPRQRQNNGAHRAEASSNCLLRRIEELREGAFSPFSQQPVVRAMLLPLGGFGGTALLKYLLVPGFS